MKKTGYLGGTITVTGAAVSGASVKVVSGTTVVAEGIANENGIVTEKIDAGAYLIVITKKGYDEYKASTTVTDGKNIVVDAELLKSAEAGAVTSITNTRL